MRNSIDHGIEDASDRNGKPETANVRIVFRDTPDSWSVQIVDDGKGIDGDRLVEKAITKGLLTNEKSKKMSQNEKLSLVFLSGLSTAESISDVSGRGVGMSAVEATVKDSGGIINLDSTVGRGTTITITIPKPDVNGKSKKAA